MGELRRWATVLVDQLLRRFRLQQPLSALLASTARLTTTAVLSYLVTVWLIDGPVDLTCSLTAILVTQTSAKSSVKMGLVRVGAVVTGVFVAIAFSAWVGLTWWSLAAVIAVSLLLAAVLRLGDQALETPISAMLILAVGGQEIAAETRVYTTLIGAGIGVAFNLLLPPRLPISTAIHQVRDVARREAESLRQAGWSMAQQPITRGEVTTWLNEAREVSDRAARAHESVSAVEEVRRYNPRSFSSPRVEPILRTGLESLDTSLFALRALYFTMQREAPRDRTTDDGYGHEVRSAFAVLLEHVADSVEAFGAVVEAEARNADEEVGRKLAGSLEASGEARALLTDLLMVDAEAQTSLWLLRGSILVAVQETVQPLNLQERARLRAQHDEAFAHRPAPLLRDMLPHPRPATTFRRGLQRLLASSRRPL
ncbi:MAG TPA: aromatic acid exporter family protein [Ornithinimicrobium sp.]|uniref:FUSC family protein n=1 Tax=Ornithinimicrobium sp. TaxID=1977084 RepID=UPI002B45C8DD|nr:aromatic acid exporter family protein [Ornithinimicrobium sp.]HKJ11499.1 aromatic acid exporter family protein [Ornithinimicrobium sp.]